MPNTGTNRRRFLSLCTDLLMAAIGLFLAIPAVAYFFGPLWGRDEEEAEAGFVNVGRVADLPPGEWRLLSVEVEQRQGWRKYQKGGRNRSAVKHAVWVRRPAKEEEGIKVLSSICPHLGCPVNAHPARGEFVCPCHGGVFDADGRLISGPPPRSMDPLAFEVRKGRLWVRWQDFKIGVAERVPVKA
jgi:Rieske Fe-S protein